MTMTIEESIDLVRTLYYTIPEREQNKRKALMKAWEGLEEYQTQVNRTDRMKAEQETENEPDIDSIGDTYSHYHEPERAKGRVRA